MNKKHYVLLFIFSILFLFTPLGHASAAGLIDIKIGDEGDLTSSVQIFIIIAVLALAPSIFILFTCFTQIIIVLSLTRQGIGTMTLPPNQVLVGLALFITVYIMAPVFTQINEEAYQPYKAQDIGFEEMVNRTEPIIKKFMVENTKDNDLRTFLKLGNEESPKNIDDISILAAVPAYTLSQINAGLFTGLMIYIGFVFIDLLVGSVLMFLGMFMLPPQMLSLPIKLLIFVYIGGFAKVVEILFNSIKV